MTDYTVHIISQRLLFRKTFNKLISVLDSDIICEEHVSDHASIGPLPTSTDGAVILDCGAKSGDELVELVLHLLSLNAEAAFIVVLDEQQDDVVDAAMNIGAMGVIIKASPPQVIISALQTLLSGERCRPAPAVDVPRDTIPQDMRRQLSARQQKMLRAIMGGQSITATARQLGITPAKLVSEMRSVMMIVRGKT